MMFKVFFLYEIKFLKFLFCLSVASEFKALAEEKYDDIPAKKPDGMSESYKHCKEWTKCSNI